MVNINSYNLNNFLFVEFETNQGPLHYSENNDLLHKLTAVISLINESANRPAGVYLIQSEAASDFSRSWLEHLSKNALKQEVANQISRWRNVGSAIKMSKVPWIYCSANDTTGSFFELSAFCHFRIWFNQQAIVGFPELKYGFFPVLGAMEQRLAWSNYFKSVGDTAGTLSAKTAAQFGLIHRSLNSKTWKKNLGEIAFNLHQNIQMENGTLAPIKNPEKRYGQAISAGKQLKKLELDEVSREILGKNPFWPEYQGLLPNKETTHDHYVAQGIIVNQGAAQFFHSAYMRYYLRELEQQATLTEVSIKDHIAIDISESPPPKSALLQLYESQKPILFIAIDSNELTRNLEISFHRIGQFLPENEARKYWDAKISWARTHSKNSPLLLSWEITQDLSIYLEEKKFRLINLESANSSFSSACYELSTSFTGNEVNFEIIDVAKAFSKRLFITKTIGINNLPMSVFVRFAFLQELVSLCSSQQLPVESMLKDLQESGWGYGSKSENWESFISHNKLQFIPTEKERLILAKYLKIAKNEIYSWTHLRDVFLDNEIKDKRKSATENSLHLAHYMTLLVLFLMENFPSQSATEINLLVQYAIGFPSEYLSPIEFYRTRGRSRFSHFIGLHWPEFSGIMPKGPDA